MRKSERSDEEHGRENRPTKNQSNDPRSIADVRQDKESNRADDADASGYLRPKLDQAVTVGKAVRSDAAAVPTECTQNDWR